MREQGFAPTYPTRRQPAEKVSPDNAVTISDPSESMVCEGNATLSEFSRRTLVHPILAGCPARPPKVVARRRRDLRRDRDHPPHRHATGVSSSPAGCASSSPTSARSRSPPASSKRCVPERMVSSDRLPLRRARPPRAQTHDMRKTHHPPGEIKSHQTAARRGALIRPVTADEVWLRGTHHGSRVRQDASWSHLWCEYGQRRLILTLY